MLVGARIPAEQRDVVFQRFDEATGGAPAVPGLGRSIVERIVGVHGGTITVQDAPQPNELSCATVNRPRLRSQCCSPRIGWVLPRSVN
jgi:signal transduction histidine kinase